jgi:hypothetical protein
MRHATRFVPATWLAEALISRRLLSCDGDDEMSNAAIASDLRRLRERVAAGSVSMDEVGPVFERLTYQLDGLREGDDARLRAFVNDIERIRFTQRPELQVSAASAVLRNAQATFDALAF